MRSSRLTALAASAALGLAATAGLAGPAPAAGTVTVGFGLAAGTHVPTSAACTVEVADGADGIAVLDAAQAKGCIVSYKTTTYDFGTFVDCINEVCSAPAEALYLTYWHMFENGTSSLGASAFSADEGDQVVFSYTTWAVSQPS